MECAICDGTAKLLIEQTKIVYRKEEFKIQKHFYRCGKCNQQFTTTELDGLNIEQVYNQYREKYQIPFPQQLIKIRERYGLSASKIAEVLGFGVNVYRNYEGGEVPNVSNGTLLNLIMEPDKFKKIVLSKKNIFSQNQLNKILTHLEKIINEENNSEISLEKYLLHKFNSPNEFTGYTVTSFEKFFNMILFFVNNAFFRLRLNKFLFYTDFVNYKRNGYSISGVPYAAITNGPVAEDYNALFSLAEEMGYIAEEESILPSGDSEEKFIGVKKFDGSIFTEAELQSLKDVLSKFQFVKTDDLKKMSHEEIGWINNRKKYELISYQDYAFLLKHI
ncbi:MAG: DUF4065 domain-containing protein [Ignavibacteriales bacterium]|nr:DUF4065 domain-containing protein [Ignavibacteriales bacterium]